MKNVLILSSSPRENGNSDTLCKEFAKGAIDAGHNVEVVRIPNKKNRLLYWLLCVSQNWQMFSK